MGKKVYMKSNMITCNLFSDIGIKVFDFNDISLDLIDSKIINQIIQKAYMQELSDIFNKN